MYRVMMVSPGGTKKHFHGGFTTEEQAEEFAAYYDWQHIDENGFRWSLEVEQDHYAGYAPLSIPLKAWAHTFLEFLQHGDDQAIAFLTDAMENTFNSEQRSHYFAIRRILYALQDLNPVVALMESDEIPENRAVIDAYRILLELVAKLAEEA